VSDPVLHRLDGAVSVITLNRPEALNAISVPLLHGLNAALRASRTARATVLRAAGRAFCAGEDLKQTLAPATGTAEELRVSLGLLQDVTRLLTSLPGPVLAAVNGHAIGGGAELALAADIVIAGPAASFRFPEAVLGHAPTGGITLRLPQIVGMLRAKDLLLTGRTVDAGEAERIGLVSRVADDPGAAAVELARSLAAAPHRSVAAVKRAVEAAGHSSQELVLGWEADAASWCFSSAEAGQSIAAFRQRASSRDDRDG
jgi:2-(1,2-epoxy-1,2-dihydrophenyl)acetyl-CoA isomerase